MKVESIGRRTRETAAGVPGVIGLLFVALAACTAAAEDGARTAGGVHDNAGIFSQDAILKADEEIARIERHGHELLVETFPAIPDARQNAFKSKPKEQFYSEWATELLRAEHGRGIVVLIVMNPGHLQIEVGAETQKKIFTAKDRQDMQAPLNEALKDKQYDDALARTVSFVQKRMDANDPNPQPQPAPAPASGVAPGGADSLHAGHGPGGTAVVYLDRVAQAVGWQEKMTREVDAADKALKQQRDAYVAQLDQALKDRKKELADAAKLPAEQAEALGRAGTPEELEKVPLPAEQRYALFLALGAVGQARESAEASYRQSLDRYRAALLDSYQSAVKPAVKRVASEGGFTMVVSPRDNLIYVDPSADVTDKVAEALKKEMPQHAPPEAPKLDLPAFRLAPLVEKPAQK